MIRRSILPQLLLLLGLALLPLAASNAAAVANQSPAPGFTLAKLQGGTASLSEYRGKVVLLNFWATWCVPCIREMPSMETLWQKYQGRGLVILAVATDNDDNGQPRIRNFMKRLKLTFPVLLDPENQASDLYEVSGVPVSYLIDREGKIAGRWLGSEDWASPEAFKLVEDLLSQ